MKLFLIRNHPRLFAPTRPFLQRHQSTFKPPLAHFNSQQPLLLRETTIEQIPLTSEEIAKACLTIKNATKASDRQQESSQLFFSLFMNMTVTVLLNVALFYQIINFMQSNDESNIQLLKKEQEESLCCHL